MYPDIKPFQARLLTITQEAWHVPTRRTWMARRDELQRSYTAAKEAQPRDFQLIAGRGRELVEHEKLSSTLLLAEEAYATLPHRLAALVQELEELCTTLMEADNFAALELFGELLNEARQVSLAV
jgi:hypothetical protein